MRYCSLSLLAFLATRAVADDLSDFSNDLATDVGPLLVLFGESMTRQYLSESTSFLDYFIFAMAPIGIITAIVSTIRVCGHSTLRAFIGRSQEGDGVVEAELCTSTSRDVCELFNKGGITRVLGRPQVLELIHIKNPGQMEDLQLFTSYLESSRSLENIEWTKAERRIPGMGHLSDDASTHHTQFAPKPNLSLNVGIKRRPKWVFVVIAILGCLLQGGVLALAGVGVWILEWNLNESGSPASTNYAPVMFITGTIIMCGGMFWCAALIGQTTKEVRYSRRTGKPSSRLIWLQPGHQVIGDQSFDAFAHLEDIEREPLQVWTSSRKDFNERFELYTFFAVTAVLLGYITQFIGLRGMKAWVSLAQLGITIVMSILRGLLRVQRLGRDANKIAKIPDMIAGHELDWLAFEIALDSSVGNTSLCITGQYKTISSPDNDSPTESETTNTHENRIDFGKVLHIRQRLSQITGHNLIRTKEVHQWESSQVKAREPAQKLAAAICKVAEKLIPKKSIKNEAIVQVQITASTGNDNKYENQMIDIALTPPKGSQKKWSIDSSLLEAILGLSMWSLVSTKALHDTDQSGNITSLAEGVVWSRIVYLSLGFDDRGSYTYAIPSIDVSIWFGPDAEKLLHDHISLIKNWTHGPADLKANHGSPALWHRVCGWNTVHNEIHSQLDLDPSTNKGTQGTRPLFVLAPTEDLLPQICAQDLFLAILSPLVNMLVTGETAILESGGHVLLQNSTVTAISDILVESGLATPFEALSCSVSLLATTFYPDPDTLHSDLIQTANTYRWNAEWERAETLMRWACLNFLKPNVNGWLEAESINVHNVPTSTNTLNRFLETLQDTGELYRWSCAQSSNKERLEFGIEGIKWMLKTFDNFSSVSSKVREVLESYDHVSVLMKDYTSKGWLPQRLSASKGITERHPLIEAILIGDKKTALGYLSFTTTMDFDRHELRSVLLFAARNGWAEIANAIIEIKGDLAVKQDLEMKDDDGRTSIFYWAKYGNLSLLQHFINLGASVNTEDNKGFTPLLVSIIYKQEPSAKLLLRQMFIDHSKKDINGLTALDWAIRNGLLGVIHPLIDLEARLEPVFRAKHGTLVLDAAKTGNKAVLDALLEANIDIESRDVKEKLRPMTKVVRKGNTTAVEVLLKCNALVEAPSEYIPWPNLLYALENGDEAMTKLLLEYTDNLEAYHNIWSSLLITVINGNWGCAQLVLQKFVSSTSMKSGDPINTPLSVTPKEKTLDLLLKMENITFAGNESRYPIEASSVDETIVKLLIRNGAKLDARNRSGETPLICAVKAQQIEMIQAILASGTDIRYTDDLRRNALSHACETGNVDITSLLLRSHQKQVLTNRKWSPCWFADRSQQAIRTLLLNACASDEDRDAMRQMWEELDASNHSCQTFYKINCLQVKTTRDRGRGPKMHQILKSMFRSR